MRLAVVHEISTVYFSGLGCTGDAEIAWAWALNSLFGVAGSIAALIISSAVGLTGATLLASITYAVAWLVLRPAAVAPDARNAPNGP